MKTWNELNKNLFEKAPKQMDQATLLQIYNKLKPKQEIEIAFNSAMASSDGYVTRIVGRKTRSKKYGVEKIALLNPKNPKAVKYYLYNRDGKISLALGDMGATLTDIKESVELDEATLHTVHVETDRAGYRKLEAMIASLDGYKESEFEKEGKASFTFDAKKHDDAERKKVTEFIKKVRGVKFSHSIKESTPKEAVEEGFKASQIQKLKKEYSKIKTIDPEGETYPKLMKLLGSLKKAELIQIADAGIKFMSSLARNELQRKYGMKENVIDQMNEAVKMSTNMTFKFPNERKAKQFAYDVSNSGVAKAKTMGIRVEVEMLATGSLANTTRTISSFMKKNKGSIEEEIANVQANIAGARDGDMPPVSKKAQKRHVARNQKKRKKELEKYSGSKVFEVSSEEFASCMKGRKKHERWNKFFNAESQIGKNIKAYSLRNPNSPIIIKDSKTGDMMFLRRRLNDMRLRHNRRKN